MLLYGVVCYVIFLAALLYLVAFLNNLWVPKGIDTGQSANLVTGSLINVGLIFLFAVQHTIMARPWFKERWKQLLPEPIERSTFVLFSSLIFIVLFWLWQPIPGVLWAVESPIAVYVIYGLQVVGWGIVLLSSFLINHFELFGLQQVYRHWRGQRHQSAQFRLPWLYRLVRHPLMLGFVIAFWSTPTMTHGHLVFSVAFTIYIFAGIHFEERDLVSNFGEEYESYRRSTAMIMPVPKRGS
ncbi:MAG: isoprenylcysteine carboxylmethyltransferase family protein [Haliangiales bacterium]